MFDCSKHTSQYKHIFHSLRLARRQLMETQFDRGQCQKAARVKVEPEPSTPPECVPIKKEPEDQQNSDCLTGAQADEEMEYRIVMKEEGGPASPGVSATADLYKDHTIKDELVIGPELLHCSTVTPVFYVPVPIKEEPEDKLNSDCLTEAQAEEKTEYGIVVKEEPSYFKGPAPPGVSAIADLYKDHTIKDELVIGPELLHCSTVTPVFCDEQLLIKREVKDKEASEEAGQERLCHVVSSETGAELENSDLDRHQKIDTAKPLNCNLEDLQTHESTHSNDKPFYCNYCDYKSNRKESVKMHERIHSGTKPFQCDYCDYKFVQKGALRRHTMTHTGEKPFQCSYCDYKCRVKPNLINHETKHTGEKPFQCDKCDYKCSKKQLLKKHELNHINPFQCPFCDYKCSQIAQLRKHEMTHNGYNRYKCKDCNFRCGKIGKLRKHELNHTSKKRLQCDYCEYKCTQYKDLLRHERTHTEAKPFKCNYCDYKCSVKSNVRKHELNHTSEKPLQCNYCNFKCSRKLNLRRHEKIHIGEKTY